MVTETSTPAVEVSETHRKRLRNKGYVYYDRDARSPNGAYVNDRLGDVVELLYAGRRRILIRRLAELHPDGTGRATIGHNELAREIASIEDDVHPYEVNRRSHKSVKVGLRSHLKRLDREGIIEWGADERRVRTTDRVHDAVELIESVATLVDQDADGAKVDS